MNTPDSQPSSRVRFADVRIASAASRLGRRRVNADASFLDDAGGYFAVADGMRDVPTSAAVSRAALSAVAEVLPARWAQRPHDNRCPDQAREHLRMGLALAHGRLLDLGAPKWTADWHHDRGGGRLRRVAGGGACGRQPDPSPAGP